MGAFARSIARARRAIGTAAMVYRRRGSGRFPPDGSPALIIDFVPTADSPALSLSFVGQSYTIDQADPVAGRFTNIQVWS